MPDHNHNKKFTSASKVSKYKAYGKLMGNKKLVLLAAVTAGLLVVAGGSAAAYYGVVAPSKPENILKKAVSNTALQTKTKFDGKFAYETTDAKATIKAVNVTFKGDADTQASKFGSAVEINASGAKLPVEIRIIDKSIFVKIGDLASVKGLAQTVAPEYGAIVDAVNEKIANQWIEADETLLKQAKANCALAVSLVLTKDDIELLQKRYQQVAFATIKNNTNDTVNGHSAFKYDIAIDDNKGVEYLKGLNDLSLVKKIKECNSDSSAMNTTNGLADNGTTPLTLWVDKASKQIIKIASQSSKQDEQNGKIKTAFEVTMQYGQAQVVRPDGAKPFLEVFGEFSQLFGGLSSSLGPQKPGQKNSTAQDMPRGNSTVSGVTPECLVAIQAYANSNGTTPIPSNCL